MINTFEEYSIVVPRGLDDFLEKLVKGHYNLLFKSAEHFISIGSILIFLSLFLLVSINLGSTTQVVREIVKTVPVPSRATKEVVKPVVATTAKSAVAAIK
jgi:hypothetical protein